jgi:hypothetical protein
MNKIKQATSAMAKIFFIRPEYSICRMGSGISYFSVVNGST